MLRNTILPAIICMIFLGAPSLPFSSDESFVSHNVGFKTTLGTFVDSLALIALYNNTNGQEWSNKWNLEEPLSSWYGVTLNDENRVITIDLDGNVDVGSDCSNNGGDGNNLIGSIPSDLLQLEELACLSLSGNQLESPIPAFIGNMTPLRVLNMHNCGFVGEIPVEFESLQNLAFLGLAGNSLSGELPMGLGGLTELKNLVISDNDLSGSIPPELGNLTKLKGLSLSNNNFQGQIPAELGNLENLDLIYLQNNNLSGCFPIELQNLCSVPIIAMSGNSGLPGGGDFSAFCDKGSGSCKTPGDGLMAYWPFDGNADDVTGNGYDGEEFGAIEYVDGVEGQAVRIDGGISEYIGVDKDFSLGDTFAISLWVKIDFDLGVTAPSLISMANAGSVSGNEIYLGWSRATGEFNVNIENFGYNTTGIPHDLSYSRCDNWSFMVYQYIHDSVELYINNQRYYVFDLSSQNERTLDIEYLVFGQDQDVLGGGFEQNQQLFGEMDEVRIYNRALSTFDIDTLFRSGFDVVCPCGTVTNISNTGVGTLREAITCANDKPGLDSVLFDIPGAGPFVIRPQSKLPQYSSNGDQWLVLDGTSQKGYNGMDYIQLDGSLIQSTSIGLRVNLGELYGLAIHSFPGEALHVLGNSSFGNTRVGAPGKGNHVYNNCRDDMFQATRSNIFIGGEGIIVQSNNVGVDFLGMESMGDNPEKNISLSNTARNILVGGRRDADEGNIIGGASVYDVLFRGSNNRLTGNNVGIGLDDNTIVEGPFGPINANVFIRDDNGLWIGDAHEDLKNIIGGAIYGIQVSSSGSRIRHNEFICNAAEALTGPVVHIAPIISYADTTVIEGRSEPGDTIEIYISGDTRCPDAPCQGRYYLGETMANSDGDWRLESPFSQELEKGDLLTALATNFSSVTSSFSACYEVCSSTYDVAFLFSSVCEIDDVGLDTTFLTNRLGCDSFVITQSFLSIPYSGEGLVAYYPFDGNANDMSGWGRNGIVNGATLTENRFGASNSAYRFNGANSGDYIELDNNDRGFNIQNHTITAWVKWEQGAWSSGGGGILSITSKNKNIDHYALTVHDWGFRQWINWEHSPDRLLAAISPVFKDGLFHHIAASYDGSIRMLFLDGEKVAEKEFSESIPFDSSSTAFIGVDFPGGNDYFKGIIDEVLLFDHALSEIDIKTLYEGTPFTRISEFTCDVEDVRIDTILIEDKLGCETKELFLKTTNFLLNDNSLLLYLPFENNLLDFGPVKKLSQTPRGLDYEEAKVGVGGYFVGDAAMIGDAGQHVILPFIDFMQSPEFSISLWVREDMLLHQDGEHYISFGHNNLSGGANVVFIGHQLDYIEFSVGDAGNRIFVPASEIKLNALNHFVLNYKADSLYAFINGELVGELKAEVIVSGSEAGMGIHWWDDGASKSTRFKGLIDELLILKRALTVEEIELLHQLGVSETFVAKPTCESYDVGIDTTYGVNYLGCNSLVYTQTYLTLPIHGEDLLAYYPFSTNANDMSGWSRNGTVHGAVLTDDRFGSPNSAYHFDGKDDYIELFEEDLKDFSVSVWIKSDTLFAKRGGIVTKSDAGLFDWRIAQEDGNEESWLNGEGIEIGFQNAGLRNGVGFETSDTTNWIHVVSTYSFIDENYKLYVNGSLEEEGLLEFSRVYNDATIRIGAKDPINDLGNKFGWFKGSIDDVLILNRVLMREEVEALYNSDPSPQQVEITIDTTICSGEVLNVHGFDFDQSGQYVEGLGCDSVLMVDLTVHDEVTLGSAIASDDLSICEDEQPLTLSANLPDSVEGEWSSNSNAIFSDQFAPGTTVTGLSAGAHTLTWTLYTPECDAYSSDDVVIFVDGTPIAKDDYYSIPYETHLNGFNPFTNDNVSPSTNWMLTNFEASGIVGSLVSSSSQTYSYEAKPYFSGEEIIIYTICNTECPDLCSTASITINVEPRDLSNFIPSGITPNGDGYNDMFEIPMIDDDPAIASENSLVVINRWGSVVYEAAPYQNDWEGTNQAGEDLPQATYYYMFKPSNDRKEITGWVAVLR